MRKVQLWERLTHLGTLDQAEVCGLVTSYGTAKAGCPKKPWIAASWDRAGLNDQRLSQLFSDTWEASTCGTIALFSFSTAHKSHARRRLL
jgi:hypothetical protein